MFDICSSNLFDRMVYSLHEISSRPFLCFWEQSCLTKQTHEEVNSDQTTFKSGLCETLSMGSFLQNIQKFLYWYWYDWQCTIFTVDKVPLSQRSWFPGTTKRIKIFFGYVTLIPVSFSVGNYKITFLYVFQQFSWFSVQNH